MQKIGILGSTGSIGRQSLEVVKEYGDLFGVEFLTACNNWQLLAEQAREFLPDAAVIANEAYYAPLRDALADCDVKVYAGSRAVEQIAGHSEVDTVISALVGYAGLFPTVNAIKHGKKIALANKETLVVAGETVMELARRHKAPVIPVDSEHSAIFQSLMGEQSPVEKIILTASGGPFYTWSIDNIANATVEQALNHPNWSMGSKITIDSASMMNKGFEVIEAHWLFGLPASKIEVLIHPQSIVHSMVQFEDGAIKAQMGLPDMRLPIQFALTYPRRLPIRGNSYDFGLSSKLDFLKPDEEKFPNLRLAYETLSMGGNAPCILNAANEEAVGAYLANRIKFLDMTRIIEHTLKKSTFVAKPSLDDCRATNDEARRIAREAIGILEKGM